MNSQHKAQQAQPMRPDPPQVSLKISRSTYPTAKCLRKPTANNQKATEHDFVVVLVDGDGAVFRDELLKRPEQGAVEAAGKLRQSVLASLETPLAKNNIIVKVFANLNGLAKALQDRGIITSKNDLFRFAQSFTNSETGFEFIDVGYGKECADHKMRTQCKKIFFAGCHDNGYINDLGAYTIAPGASERIILVETTPVEPHFRTTQLPILKFGQVFRSVSLNDVPIPGEQRQARVH
ncbi:hypothetical protein N7495_002829 [Penicillium taxi]|uniref:uncharacterized protein n=1 Tax=Penicillium taxi TaxID=168475 RepID=UPI0025451458|nr:uncharacterized protein N7495_002829 [Penicillium taxi]KAJ5902301.1 hypothetical protein N7495_002829 [Penicillium taxi]